MSLFSQLRPEGLAHLLIAGLAQEGEHILLVGLHAGLVEGVDALAHVEGGVPNLIVRAGEINPCTLGELIYFFEYACGLSGYLPPLGKEAEAGLVAGQNLDLLALAVEAAAGGGVLPGSYLGARAAIELLCSNNYNLKKKDTPNIYFTGNGLSGDAMQEIIDLIGGATRGPG